MIQKEKDNFFRRYLKILQKPFETIDGATVGWMVTYKARGPQIESSQQLYDRFSKR